MKKTVLAAVLTGAMCLGLAAPALADVQIAFSQIGQESDWRTANTDSINGTIEAHEGWELIYDDAQQKQENQIKALRNFITQGVDVILFTGVVSTGWEEVLKEVNDEGIPLILVDRLPDCIDQIESGIDGWLERYGYIREGAYYRHTAEEKPQRTIALFSHGGSSAAAMGHILNLQFPCACALLHIDHTGITVVQMESRAGGGTLSRLTLTNDANHIRKLKDPSKEGE